MNSLSDNRSVESGNLSPDQMERHSLLRSLIRHVPYSLGSPFFRLLLGNALAHKVVSGQIKLLRKLYEEFGVGSLSKEQIDVYMQVNFTNYWRLHALMMAPKSVFERFVSIENIEVLNDYYGKRGVVLCNSHYGAGKLVPVVVARSGYDLHSLDRLDVFTHRNEEGIGRIDSIALGKKGGNFHLKQLFKCKKALTDKGVLHIAADGFRGGSGLKQSFLGRIREFRKSFAELAVSSGAVVIPVFSTLDRDGYVNLKLLPALDPEEIEGDKDARIGHLCAEYKTLLEAYWREAPENVFKNDLKIFSELEFQEDISGG